VLIGQFALADGRTAVLLNNHNPDFTLWPTFDFGAHNVMDILEVNQGTGREVPLLDDSPLMAGLQLNLRAGMGRLLIMAGVGERAAAPRKSGDFHPAATTRRSPPVKTDGQTAQKKSLPAVVGVAVSEAYFSLAPSFLTFDSRLTAAQITASPKLGRYSFVWGARATHVSAYRANPHNAGIKLGYYISYDRFGIPRGQNASSPFEYWNSSEHFDWLLYKCDRVTPVTWGDSAAAKTMAVVDPGNPEVVAYQLKTHAVTAVRAGYDAISADNVHLSNVRGQCGVWQKGKTKGSRVWKQLYDPSRSHHDPAWADTVVRWAQQFSAGLKMMSSHAGRPIDLIPNFSVQSSDGWADTHTLALMNATDGALSESGFTQASLRSSKPHESDWIETVSFFQNLNRHGKPLWAICEWGGSKSVGNVSITEDVRQWVAATFMMGRGAAANASGVALVPVSECKHFHRIVAVTLELELCFVHMVLLNWMLTYSCPRVIVDGAWSDWPEFAVPVGAAMEEAQRLSSGVWRRQFSAAVSIVNPGNVSRQAVVPTGTWKTLDGILVPAGTKTIRGQTGLILLKQEELSGVLKSDDG
jgi:hypothetical protein